MADCLPSARDSFAPSPPPSFSLLAPHFLPPWVRLCGNPLAISCWAPQPLLPNFHADGHLPLFSNQPTGGPCTTGKSFLPTNTFTPTHIALPPPPFSPPGLLHPKATLLHSCLEMTKSSLTPTHGKSNLDWLPPLPPLFVILADLREDNPC